MEPLAALSLAACIAQFVDFGCKLVNQSHEVADAGATLSTQHLNTITGDLLEYNSSLEAQIKHASSETLQFTAEEQVGA